MAIENMFKNPDDKLIFAKVLDKYTATTKKRNVNHTNFLDPARCAAFLQVLNSQKEPHVVCTAIGGYPNAERNVILFAPDSHSDADCPVIPLEVSYNSKFAKGPTHRDYLGAVLGLGLDRGKIGDICITDAGAIIYVLEDVANFILESLNQVGRVPVKIAIGSPSAQAIETGQVRRITVPSMRLDAVVSSALNMSRGKAAALIEAERVFVNWKLAKKTHTITVGDAITVRGMGRVMIDEICGNTRKDRIVLEVTVGSR